MQIGDIIIGISNRYNITDKGSVSKILDKTGYSLKIKPLNRKNVHGVEYFWVEERYFMVISFSKYSKQCDL